LKYVWPNVLSCPSDLREHNESMYYIYVIIYSIISDKNVTYIYIYIFNYLYFMYNLNVTKYV